MIQDEPIDGEIDDFVAEVITRVEEILALLRRKMESVAAVYGPLRTTQVSRYLGVSAKWLRRAEQRGLIPEAKQDQRGRYYTVEDLEELENILNPDIERMPDNKSIFIHDGGTPPAQ